METIAGVEEASWLRAILIGRNPRRTFTRIVVLVVASFVVFRFGLLPIRVEGMSMMPTYHENGINFVNRLVYVLHEPRRGDVVAVRTSGVSIMYMKRIIALPNETIAFHNGHAVIDGRVLDEPYVKYQCDWEVPPQRLHADEYYVVGDNRSMPPNDHTKGAAARIRIVGKILL